MKERLAAIENRLAEVDSKLDRILAYIEHVQSEDYQTQVVFRSLSLNVLANKLADNDTQRLSATRP